MRPSAMRQGFTLGLRAEGTVSVVTHLVHAKWDLGFPGNEIWNAQYKGVDKLKKMLGKVLLFAVTLSMLLTMLPGAVLGEARTTAAKSVVEKKKDRYLTALMIFEKSNDKDIKLPEGTKPVDKIIPRRCVTVRHNHQVTIQVVIAPATRTALKNLKISWNESKLDLVGAKSSANSNRVTMNLTFEAIGRPTDTTQVSYQSLIRKSVKSRTFVTIVPTKVTGVRLTPPSQMMFINQDLPLAATVLPDEATNKAVRWYSTNKNVATVSPTGLVTAHAVGKATIYVVTRSGGKKAKCAIEVSQPLA
jgi:hypothetical protein